jgi:hypothetical protein
MTHHQPRAFVALMSVVIISAILLMYVFVLSSSSFFARFDSLDRENKRISLSRAESCVNAALLKIAQDAAYAPTAPETVTVSGGTCTICQGTNSTNVLTRAVHNGAYTNIRATVAVVSGTYTITSWSEDAVGDAACTLP